MCRGIEDKLSLTIRKKKQVQSFGPVFVSGYMGELDLFVSDSQII
jgi:hypothetical protein